MAKKVLVSYLERKQVFEIPSSVEDDISYLTSEVLKGFTFDMNVNLEVTFQKYDEDWEEYLDVSKDYKVEEKDRLKAVVMPSLTDTTVGGQSSSSQASITEVHLSLSFSLSFPPLFLSPTLILSLSLISSFRLLLM